MKKSLSWVLTFVFVIGITGTAFAANPFVDVPAKHWSYDAISQLVKAGIVDGYSDGTFRGDKTMTRYEMAQIVAKAIAKADKADAVNKALIEKLSAEYSTELNKLSVRMTNVEKKVNSLDNVKFNGEIRARYEWGNNQAESKNVGRVRYRIYATAPLNDTWTAKFRLTNQINAGVTDSGAKFDQVYVTGPALGATWDVGRYYLWLGQGFTGVDTSGWDGAKVTLGNQVKLSLGVGKKFGSLAAVKNDGTIDPAKDGAWYKFADLNYKPGKIFNATSSYLHSSDPLYRNWMLGFKYTGLENVALKAEYGKNNFANAKAWAARITYKAYDLNKEGSFDMYAGYKKAENGYDPKGLSTQDTIDAFKTMNDIKGWDVGLDYTLMKNARFTFWYGPYTTYDGNADKHQYVGQVQFYF